MPLGVFRDSPPGSSSCLSRLGEEDDSKPMRPGLEVEGSGADGAGSAIGDAEVSLVDMMV